MQRFDGTRRDGLTAVRRPGPSGFAAEPSAHRFRPKSWPSDLVRAVERLRLDFPMWGWAMIGPLVRAEGLGALDRTVGRIIAHLVRARADAPPQTPLPSYPSGEGRLAAWCSSR